MLEERSPSAVSGSAEGAVSCHPSTRCHTSTLLGICIKAIVKHELGNIEKLFGDLRVVELGKRQYLA